ncbi:hypothetical protein [Ferroacidibacillus organovorans]|uniref:hypothetical protein n=1 Tax=Ferroacidibacillus organovorans TaxID=1765683 RepID=UPI0008330BFB|nr:hypothetical protein [Ferroacidibacillus organovorans]
MNTRRALVKQFTDTYLNEIECNSLLETHWPLLRSLLPPKWWYDASPIRRWITYSRFPSYTTALTLLGEELQLISDSFPSSYRDWIGSIGVPGAFWSKRFESMVIFLLLRSALPVDSIEPTDPGSKNVLDIKLSDGVETVFVECTSLRNADDESGINEASFGMDYFNHRFSEIKGSYHVTCNVMPDLTNKEEIDRFVVMFRYFIETHRPQEKIKWSSIDGFPHDRLTPGLPAARITPVPGNTCVTIGHAGQSGFMSMSNTLRNALQRKIKQVRDYDGQKIIMVDGSFNTGAFISNALGVKTDVHDALETDKQQCVSVVTLSQMDITSPERIITPYAFIAPWANISSTKLTQSILVACNQQPEQLQRLKSK